MAPEHTWRMARTSVNNQNCVELRDSLDQVRDSKNATGPVLRGDIRAMVRAARADRFDR